MAALLGRVLAGGFGAIDTSNGEAVAMVVRSMSNGLLLTGLVVGAVFGMFAASTSSLETTLDIAGAGRRDRTAVLFVPSVSIAATLAVALATFSLVPMLAFIHGTVARAVIAAVTLPLVALAAAMASAVQVLVSRAMQRYLRLPGAHAGGGATAVTLAAWVFVCLPALKPSMPRDGARSLLPDDVPAHVRELMTGGGVRAIAAAVAGLLVLGAGIASSFRAASARPTVTPERAPAFLVRSTSVPNRTIRVHAWYEFVTLLRNPTTTVLALAGAGCGLDAAAFRHGLAGKVALLALPAIAGAVGLRASGHNLRAAWTLWAVAGWGSPWVVGKLVGTFLVAATLFIPSAVVIALVAGPATAAPLALQVFLPTVAGATLAGTILPISDEQPLGTAMTAALTGVWWRLDRIDPAVIVKQG